MKDEKVQKMDIRTNPYEVNGMFNPTAYLVNNYSVNLFVNKFYGDFNMIYLEEFKEKVLKKLNYHEIILNTEFLNSEIDLEAKDSKNEIEEILNEEGGSGKHISFMFDDNESYYYANKDHSAFLSLRRDKYYDSQIITVEFTYLKNSQKDYEFIFNTIKSYKNPPKTQDVYFYRIGRTPKNYFLSRYHIEPIDIKPEYYNNTLEIDNLVKIIDNKKSGLIIFSGLSGSGKTSLIKYLSCNSNKKFVFLTINEIDIFSDPNATEFLSQNLRDSIIIVEDCEILLKTRKLDSNPHISTLLNMGDGLIGQLLNMKVILTYNNSEHVDDALLRKGRCLFRHNFDKVSAEIATKISKDLGYNQTYKQPQVLCDIFNIEDNGLKQENHSQIGFGKK
ncbi:MAG: AAA family ATPase [bacterium]